MTIYNATPAITSDNHSPLQSNFNIVTKSINHSIVITRPTPATGGTLFGFGTCHSSRKNIFLCRLWSLNKNISVSLLMPHTVIIKSSKWSKSAEFLQSFIISTCHPPHKSITIHFGDGIVIFFPNLRYFRNTIQSARASGTIVETCTEQSSVKTQSNPLFTKLNGK